MTSLFETTSCEPLLNYSTSTDWSLPEQGQSCLLVAATGLGKTVMMAGIAGAWPQGRVMMISHRFELNQQAMKAFERFAGCDVDLEQADWVADQRSQLAHVVVASVQTLNSKRKRKYRMERFKPNQFGLLMIDEAHRAAAASYRRVVDYFRRENPGLHVLGVTATPDRGDKVGLGCVFDRVVGNYDLRWGIENGWLVPLHQKCVRIEHLDLSNVRTRGGDLDERQLSHILEIESVLHEMAVPIVEVCEDRRQCIVFTASVAQAHRLREIINDYMAEKYGRSDAAVSIDGSLPPQHPKRRRIVADFRAGNVQYLVNCGVATEGFDAPNVEVIAVGRPTKSRALYCQMIGRGTRALPGLVDAVPDALTRRQAIAQSAKPHCTVLDFVGQAGRHKLVCTIDVLAGDAPTDVRERALENAKKGAFDRDTLEELEKAREQLALEREARRAKLTVDVKYQIVDADSKYRMSQIPERKCPGYLKHKQPSDKQCSMLKRLGYTDAQIATMNPRSASGAIDYAIRHPRTGFGKWLRQKKIEDGTLQG